MKLSTLVLLFISIPVVAVSQSLDNWLVAYYPFDGDFNDASGNGHNLTPEGNPAFVSGVVEGAVYFDGIDDAAMLPYILVSENGYTWTAWVLIDQTWLSNLPYVGNAIICQCNSATQISPSIAFNPGER